MEPIKLTPFQRIAERLMTDDEIRVRAKEHDLPQEALEFILERFQETRSMIETREEYWDEEDFARGDGRLGCDQSHQDVWDGLAIAMGVPEEEVTGEDLGDKYPNVEVVFRHFFDE